MQFVRQEQDDAQIVNLEKLIIEYWCDQFPHLFGVTLDAGGFIDPVHQQINP